jgi:hypothetical protein
MGVIRAGVVSDPSIVLGVNVRRFGMPGLIAIAGTCVFRLPAAVTAIRRNLSRRRLSGSVIWRRPASRNVTAANMHGATTVRGAACTATARGAPALLPRKSSHG